MLKTLIQKFNNFRNKKICKKVRSKKKFILPILLSLVAILFFTIYKNALSNDNANFNIQNQNQENNHQENQENQNNSGNKTSILTKQTKDITIQTLAVIKGEKEVNLSFKEGGKISTIYYQEGDFVSKGSLIAFTTSEEQRINLEFQQKMLDQKYDIKDLTKKYYDRLINNAKYQLEQAEKDLPEGDSKDITINQLENAVKTYKELRNLNHDSSELSAIASELQQKLANVSVNNTKIYAPFDGYILKKYFEEQELAPTGTPVIHFVSKDLVLKSSLIWQDANKVNTQTKVIALSNMQDQENQLTVTKINNYINEHNRLVDLEIKLPNSPEKLFYNQVVPITIIVEQKDLLAVNKAALTYDFDGSYINTEENQKIKVEKVLEDKDFIYIPYSQELQDIKVLH